MSKRTQRKHHRPWRIVTTSLAVTALMATAGCGDDDTSGAQVVALSEWVHEFEQSCAEVGAQLSASGLTEEQRTEINDRAIAEMRSIGQPDELADTAEELLNDLEESQQPGLDDETISALDERMLAAIDALGISGACAGDVPAE